MALIPQQTEAQRKAAFEAAGLTPEQQAGVTEGTGYTPRYSRVTEDEPEAPSYDSLYENKRQAELNRQQDLIQSTEKIYNEKRDRELKVEEELGARDVARENTISAITGMMGAPDATTRQGRAETRTAERKRGVEERIAAEKSAALSAIFGRIDDNAARAAEIELSTKREDQQRLREETSRNALNNILSFAQQDGVGWDKFSRVFKEDKDLQAEVSRTGKTLPELYELYTSTQKAPPKKEYSWRGDNLVVLQEDADGNITTQTFDAKDLGIPKGTDFQTLTLGESVYWIDKSDPFNADGSPKLTRLGAAAKSGTNTDKDAITLASEDKRTLLGVGFSEPEIKQLEDGVRTYGLTEVLKKEEEAGATPEQLAALRRVYGGEKAPEPSKLTRETMAKYYDIEDSMKKTGGFLGFGGTTGKDQLDTIMAAVERLQAVGLDDDEILKKLDEDSE